MNQNNARKIFSYGFYQFRQRKNLKLGDLAKILNVSIPSPSTIQNGKSLPTFDKIYTLVENGMQLNEIFGDELADKLVKKYNLHKVENEPLSAAKQTKEILSLLLQQVEKLEIT